MRYVVAVAETGSFTRAARRCLVVQSALSHQIARLERELGTRLFARTSRSVRLTAAGAAFLPSARQCLAAADRAGAEVAAATGRIRGRLTIGVIPTVAAVDVPGTLADYRRRHPDVRVELRMGSSVEMIEQVREAALDLAFLGLPVGAPPKNVRVRQLASDRHVAVLPPGHPLAGESRVSLARLADETFVDFPPYSSGRTQSDRAFARAGLTRDVAFEVTAADLMGDLIRRGLGVGILPGRYAPRLTGLARVPVSDGPSRIEYLVWNRLGASPAVSAFLDVVRPDSGGTDGLDPEVTVR